MTHYFTETRTVTTLRTPLDVTGCELGNGGVLVVVASTLWFAVVGGVLLLFVLGPAFLNAVLRRNLLASGVHTLPRGKHHCC